MREGTTNPPTLLPEPLWLLRLASVETDRPGRVTHAAVQHVLVPCVEVLLAGVFCVLGGGAIKW